MDPANLQRLYLDDVWRFVSSRLDRQEDAEDVTMEVMAAAFERVRNDTVVADYRLWLLTIAKNKVADALRRLGPGEAASEVAKALGLPRRDLYRRAIELQGRS